MEHERESSGIIVILGRGTGGRGTVG